MNGTLSPSEAKESEVDASGWPGHKQFEIGGKKYVIAEIGSVKDPPLVQFNLRLRKKDISRWQFLLFGAICSSLTAFAIKLLQ